MHKVRCEILGQGKQVDYFSRLEVKFKRLRIPNPKAWDGELQNFY